MIKKLLSYRPTKQDFLALEHSETNNALSILGVSTLGNIQKVHKKSVWQSQEIISFLRQ